MAEIDTAGYVRTHDPRFTVESSRPSFDGALWGLLRAVLAERALLWFALLTTAGAFAWALAEPHWLRLLGAGSYCGLVYLPLLWRTKG